MIRMNLPRTAPLLSQDANRSQRGRRIAALIVPLFAVAMGACDPDRFTGPGSHDSSGLPPQPVPVECPRDAVSCHEFMF
jgi:hypothetical protein